MVTMFRFAAGTARSGLLAGAVAVLVSGCGATTTLKKPNLVPPPAATAVLLMKPDVQLSELTAAGLEEPNAQWTAQGLANVRRALQDRLRRSEVSIVPYQEPSGDPEREHAHVQLLKLHAAVGSTLIRHYFNQGTGLPTKVDTFDYTLGSGAARLRDEFATDYALFVYLHDSYASGGRVALMIAMAAFGAVVPGGTQRGFASLVDLRSGDIAWFNVVVSGLGDLRTPDPAESAVEQLLTELPL